MKMRVKPQSITAAKVIATAMVIPTSLSNHGLCKTIWATQRPNPDARLTQNESKQRASDVNFAWKLWMNAAYRQPACIKF
jgi:hypothetical protein